MKKIILFLVFSLITVNLYSQGTTCATATPFCGADPATTPALIFPSATTGSAGTQGCLFSSPRPAWFYFKVDQGGTLVYDIIQNRSFNAAGFPTGATMDVDFAVWGPFTSATGNCGNLVNNCSPSGPIYCRNNTTFAGDYPVPPPSNLVDCSYDGAPVEKMTIAGAVPGQYYLAMVTNFAGGPGFIKLAQRLPILPTYGATDCDIVCGISLGPDRTECGGTSITITAAFADTSFTGTAPFQWLLGGVPQPAYDNMQTITVNTPGTWSVTTKRPGGCYEVTDSMVYSIYAIPVTQPTDIVICTSSTAPYIFPSINKDAQILGALPASDYTITYHTTQTAADNGTPSIPFASLTNYSTPTSPTRIYVRIEDNATFCATTRFFDLIAATGPSGTFSYASSTYCTSVTTPQPIVPVSLTPNGTFTSNPAGLTINPTTGEIIPSTSTPTNYTVNYHIDGTASCPPFDTSTTVTIAPVLTPTINCGTSTTTSVIFNWAAVTGATGYDVSYQINANPVVNVGAIGNVLTYSVTSLTPGDTVVITLTPTGPAGSCFSSNTQSCIANNCTPPTAAISYSSPSAPNTSFCESDTVPKLVYLSGTGLYTPGTYASDPTTLIIDSTTGIVTPNGSPAGVYTVTYSVTTTPPGCSQVTATTLVTINALPSTPLINTAAATCSANASSTITNYVATQTYLFNPAGPSVGATGLISGMTIGTSYTVTTNNGSCTSLVSAPFSNVAMLTTPATPLINTAAATCSATGSSTITNYVATQTYIFNPTGPSVGAGGVISSMVAGTGYTVIANNGSCDSSASASFANAVMLTTPATPLVTTAAATCSANGTSTMSNYVATQTYLFNPAGPSIGATGLISGMTIGVGYTVTTNNGSCTSLASASFSNAAMLTVPATPLINTAAATCSATGSSTITNYVATQTYIFDPTGPSVGAGGVISSMVAGTGYTVIANNGSCDSLASASFTNAVMLTTPATPLVTTAAATCSANGSSTITNYVATQTYTFNPTGPSVGAGGVISGMVAGTDYTVITNNGSCNSSASAIFKNAVMLTTPVTPLISTAAATCSANGTSTMSNYVATQTYLFNPTGPSIGATGLISGMVIGTGYTVTTNNGSCTSLASASFSNAAMLTTPATPLINTAPATCSANGSSTITNYIATQTYTFNPTGPSVGAGGVISSMVAGTDYTVIANNGSCNSLVSVTFKNAVMLTTPATPLITSAAATCSANGSSTITNYVATQTYTFNPTGPSVGAGGVISSMVAGTDYTVIANNGSCNSLVSVSFKNAVMLTTPATPLITGTAATCSANGSSTITNYVATQTYIFNPSGPSVGATGLISGMTIGVGYTVTTNNGSCTSLSSASFSNAAMFPTPTLVITNPTAVCSPSTIDITAASVTVGSSATSILSYWSDAAGTIALTNANAISVTGIYYIKLTVNGCSDIKPVQATINNPSAPTVTTPLVYCLNDQVNPLSAIGTNLLWYTTATGGTGSATAPTPATTAVGSANYYVSQTIGICEGPRAVITVNISEPPTTVVATPSDYFADLQTITVTVTPVAGIYEYQIDNGAFQSSNIFANVGAGQHTITVRNECDSISTTAYIVDYPRYFTPNADGYHDTWNIPELKGQANSKVLIFDRFGKLIKEIRPSGSGWNGTFNGKELPSTDYWFIVTYEEKGITKEHKAHFSMKR